ncbi:MAG: kynureninase [Burkholderiaceae bacterium]
MTRPTFVPDLAHCQALDAADPLRSLRDLFHLPQGVIYLDGNSLGALPKATPARLAQVIAEEWGVGLIRSWNTAGWFGSPQQVGDKIARLIGARLGEVVATDSTSINLFKVLSATISIATNVHSTGTRRINNSKNVLLSERSNFPTDLYIAQSLCTQHNLQLRLVQAHELTDAITEDVAIVLLTQVHYRSGAMHDMAAVTARAHAAGALTVWDLAHSAGAVPIDVHAANADFAVGCGYKFLNGGPGAPAFVWAHPRHVNAAAQPLAGWFGHAAPFAFTPGYEPAQGITRFLCGTPPVISMAALECGLDSVLAAEPLGGMAALRAKSLALTDLFIALAEARCADHGLQLATPRAHAQRGSQLSFYRAEGGYAIMQALIARGVIGDFRAGDPSAASGSLDGLDILRFGFTPLYGSYCDVWQAVEQLRQVLDSREWQQPQFNRQQAVT